MKKLLSILVILLFGISVKSQNTPNPYASIGKKAPNVVTMTNGAYDEFLLKQPLVLINGDAVDRKTGELVYSKEKEPEMLAMIEQKQKDKFRFLSVDPLTRAFAYYSPYQYAGNTPIQAIDLDGLEEFKITSANTMKITAVIGVVRQNDPVISESKNYSSINGKLNITRVNADLKTRYPSSDVNLSEKEAKGYGFTPNKEGIYKVQYDITVKDLNETAPEFYKADKKNAAVLVGDSKLKDAGSANEAPTLRLNQNVFGSGTYEEQGAKIVDTYNKIATEKGDAPITTGTPGQVIGHEFGHKLLNVGDPGHKDNSILDVKNTVTTPADTKEILRQNKGEIKKQNK